MIALIETIAAVGSSAQVECPAGDTCNSSTTNTGLPKVSAGNYQLHEVLAIFFGIAAVIAVLMIIIGALMFITSGGNSENATKARETIMYAAIGLVVSLFAEGVVAFVIGKV